MRTRDVLRWHFAWWEVALLVPAGVAWALTSTFSPMPRELKTKTIGGLEYRIRQLGAWTAQKVLFKVGRVVPALFAGKGITPEMLSGDDFDWIVQEFAAATEVQVIDPKHPEKTQFFNLKAIFDEHFAGKYESWGEWLGFAWEANFGSFFSVAARLVGAREALMTSVSPKAATGSAGESSSASA